METQTIRYSFTRNFNNSCSDCSVFCDDQEKNDNNETCKKIVIWSPTGPKSTGMTKDYTIMNGQIVGPNNGKGFRCKNVNLGLKGQNNGFRWYLINVINKEEHKDIFKSKISQFKDFNKLYNSLTNNCMVFVKLQDGTMLLFTELKSGVGKRNIKYILGYRIFDTGKISDDKIFVPNHSIDTYTLIDKTEVEERKSIIKVIVNAYESNGKIKDDEIIDKYIKTRDYLLQRYYDGEDVTDEHSRFCKKYFRGCIPCGTTQFHKLKAIYLSGKTDEKALKIYIRRFKPTETEIIEIVEAASLKDLTRDFMEESELYSKYSPEVAKEKYLKYLDFEDSSNRSVNGWK